MCWFRRPYVACNGHTGPLIQTHLDFRGKNRETGRAYGPKHQTEEQWGTHMRWGYKIFKQLSVYLILKHLGRKSNTVR